MCIINNLPFLSYRIGSGTRVPVRPFSVTGKGLGFLKKIRGASEESSNVYWSTGLAVIYCILRPITWLFSVTFNINTRNIYWVFILCQGLCQALATQRWKRPASCPQGAHSLIKRGISKQIRYTDTPLEELAKEEKMVWSNPQENLQWIGTVFHCILFLSKIIYL